MGDGTKNVKILLVDDSEVMLRHVSGLLAQKKWQVITASTMAAGLEAFYRHSPDALLADFVLEGGHTGLETIAAIFALCANAGGVASPTGKPLVKPTVAILTQGALSPTDQQKAAALGAPVLQKPVYGKEQDFLMSITLWLNKAGIL